jgi:hypothetical protein
MGIQSNRFDKRTTSWAAGLLLACWILIITTPSPGWAGPCEEPSVDTSSGLGVKAAAWLLTIPYSIAKGGVALFGGLVSIPIYIMSLGSESAARAVWLPSVSGTYILTPAHLTGKQPIRFLAKCPEG